MLFAASRSMFNTKNRCWRNLIAVCAAPYPSPSFYSGFCNTRSSIGQKPSAQTPISEFQKVRSEANKDTRRKLNSVLYNSLIDPRLDNGTRAFMMEEIRRHNNKDKEDLRDPEHKYWKVSMERCPDPKLTRDELIDSYVNILSRVVGSEEEANKRIFIVSTAWAFDFGAVIPEKEFRDKLKGLPEVDYVYPVDIRGRTRCGQPFVNGKAARYDPFYYVWFYDTSSGTCSQTKKYYARYRYNPEVEESSRPCIEDEEDLNNPKHEYWRVTLQNSPDETQTKDGIIESYVKILAKVVGSEEEAKKKIFIVSAYFDFYFGVLLPEKELRDKLEGLPEVGGLVPLDIKGRTRGEPFINGKACGQGYDEHYYMEFTRPGTPFHLSKRPLPAPNKTKRVQTFRVPYSSSRNRYI